jgi:succinate dehydrogenase flavin-adding protein (antitoxin of CptAB toxin-antitoxin module)
MTDILKPVYQTPDGQTFDNKADAEDHMRRPKKLAALMALTSQNDELANWLLTEQEAVENAFDTGTIRRVSKTERNKLKTAFDRVKELAPAETTQKLNFLVEHADDILESFRWPTVKRMTDEEKATAAKNTLMGASDNNEDLSNWVLAHKDGILEAYKAGIVKREVNPNAKAALAAYREKKAAEKAAAEGGEAAAADAPAAAVEAETPAAE